LNNNQYPDLLHLHSLILKEYLKCRFVWREPPDILVSLALPIAPYEAHRWMGSRLGVYKWANPNTLMPQGSHTGSSRNSHKNIFLRWQCKYSQGFIYAGDIIITTSPMWMFIDLVRYKDS
jgi:hypothetical protein